MIWQKSKYKLTLHLKIKKINRYNGPLTKERDNQEGIQ